MIGCAAVNVRAPPASGKSSAISLAPSVARKLSAALTVQASSTSHARVRAAAWRDHRVATLTREYEFTRNRRRPARLAGNSGIERDLPLVIQATVNLRGFDYVLVERDLGLGAAAGRRALLGPADGSHLPAPSASAEELIAAIGLEPRNAHSGRHLEPLQDLSRLRIDSPQIALVTFPGAVPELAIDPGDPGDEAVGLDGAKNRPGLGIDLMDLPIPILPDPERPFGPREPRVTAAAGRRDRGEHTAGVRIDLLDAILGELKQVLAVEGRSRMRGDIDRAQRLPARRIEGVQLVSGSKPDVLAVIRDSIHAVDARKGSIFTEDFGC